MGHFSVVPAYYVKNKQQCGVDSARLEGKINFIEPVYSSVFPDIDVSFFTRPQTVGRHEILRRLVGKMGHF